MEEEEKLKELERLLHQIELERVVPKMDIFRKPKRIKLAKSGRGTGKSWSVASLLIQRAEREKTDIVCFREQQNSLVESAYKLMTQTIDRLEYTGWNITNTSLVSRCGSRIIFRGAKDEKASRQIKSYEDFDIFWLEEASAFSKDSIDLLLPTLRKPGSELWATWNPDTEYDPIYTMLWNSHREDVFRVDLIGGYDGDNPWWSEELEQERRIAYLDDPDEAMHVWGGVPRKESYKCIIPTGIVMKAMRENKDDNPVGAVQIGCDVARFGDDWTVIYKRKGLKIIDKMEYHGIDLMWTANACWDMAGHDPSVMIVVDAGGVGSGVVDKLVELGAKVQGIMFQMTAVDQDHYTTVADEMWFGISEVLKDAVIPYDLETLEELTSRQFEYDSRGRRKIESKDKYKKRKNGKSPDHADGLILCYSNYGMQYDQEVSDWMKGRLH